MMPISKNDIESELSYAYLHAVATKAGATCQSASRLEDNAGIDATLTVFGPFEKCTFRTEVDIKVQLKATTSEPLLKNGYYSYSLMGIDRYDALRSDTYSTPRLLVVLFLPKDENEWLTCSEEQLALKRCSYWVSLFGAKPSKNQTAQTVYLPKAQVFGPKNLRVIANRLANKEKLHYEIPDNG